MGTSDPAGEAPGPAITHPDTSVPAEVLHAAYVAVVSAIARYEPDALLRVARDLEDDGFNLPGELPAGTAVRLARSWLAFTGHSRAAGAWPSERVFSFAYPATLTFDMVGTGTPKSAGRRALRALRAIEAEDVPLGAVSGPHPTHPALLNVTVWVGSYERDGDDRLRLELATGGLEAEG